MMSLFSSNSDATIELTLLSINLFEKSKSTFVIASIHDSTKTLTHKHPIHFPLSSRTLQNPISTQISIQIVSSRFPFRPARLLAADSISLSSVHLAGDVRTLNMLSPSGKMYGTLKVSLRAIWALGPASDCERSNLRGANSNCGFNGNEPPTTLPISVCSNVGGFEEVSQCSYALLPTAPPISEFYNVGGLGEIPLSEMDDFEGCKSPFSYVVSSTAPQGSELSDVDCEYVECNEVSSVEFQEAGDGECKCIHKKVVEEKSKGYEGEAWRSFMVGLVSGSFAVVLISMSVIMRNRALR